MTTDIQQIILDSAQRLFAEGFPAPVLRAAATGEWLALQWKVLEEAGLPLAMVSEEHGGFGIELTDAFAVIRLAAEHAVPLPLTDTMLANYLCSRAGLELARGPATIALPKKVTLTRSKSGWAVDATANGVCWPENVDALVLVANCSSSDKPCVVRLRRGQWALADVARSLTGIPCGRIIVNAAVSDSDCKPITHNNRTDIALLAGAGVRAVSIAGAVQRIVDTTVAYVQERSQFGKPLSKFQVIQHDIAKMASLAAAATAAADMAIDSFVDGLNEAPIAIAKARTSEAVGQVAAIAHQLHGAIGVTEEFHLHHLTRQLWAWRDEFGSEVFWNNRLGRSALGQGAGQLWPFLTKI